MRGGSVWPSVAGWVLTVSRLMPPSSAREECWCALVKNWISTSRPGPWLGWSSRPNWTAGTRGTRPMGGRRFGWSREVSLCAFGPVPPVDRLGLWLRGVLWGPGLPLCCSRWFGFHVRIYINKKKFGPLADYGWITLSKQVWAQIVLVQTDRAETFPGCFEDTQWTDTETQKCPRWTHLQSRLWFRWGSGKPSWWWWWRLFVWEVCC